jgi:Ca2+-binding RTX toxin-like protein
VKLPPLLAACSIIGFGTASPAEGATAFVTGSFPETVHYVADPGEANRVSMDEGPDSAGVEITDAGATIAAGPGCVSVTPTTVQCDSDEFLIEASLGDGDDFLTISKFLDSLGGRLSGGDGDDRIRGADTDSFERLLGGSGDDSLFGRGGTDFLDGGPGADDLSGGTSCESGLAGVCSTDFDVVSYSTRTRRVRATANGIAADDGERGEGDTIMADVETIVGGQGNDVLGGTTTNFSFLDGIPHLSGMRLVGRGGDDVLVGGRAPDVLNGNEGDDKLIGGRGKDRLGGGPGSDRLVANDGRMDRVKGGRGRDEARIDAGLDRVRKVEEIL